MISLSSSYHWLYPPSRKLSLEKPRFNMSYAAMSDLLCLPVWKLVDCSSVPPVLQTTMISLSKPAAFLTSSRWWWCVERKGKKKKKQLTKQTSPCNCDYIPSAKFSLASVPLKTPKNA